MIPDDDTIDLRGKEEGGSGDEPEFRIGEQIEKRHRLVGEVEAVGRDEFESLGKDSQGMVKVKFDKFVNLIATHAYEEVFDKHTDEDVVISTDLLTDLANAHEEKSDKKVPMIFIVGIVIGVVLTWVILRI
ncbi:MAG: hypothetical protein V1679_00615 [Candidatus Peregrinibacteria bacterium]